METTFADSSQELRPELADMKPFEVRKTNRGTAIRIPKNCMHPQILPPLDCKAIHPSNPECGCRYCVFNRYYATIEASEKPVVDVEEDEEEEE